MAANRLARRHRRGWQSDPAAKLFRGAHSSNLSSLGPGRRRAAFLFLPPDPTNHVEQLTVVSLFILIRSACTLLSAVCVNIESIEHVSAQSPPPPPIISRRAFHPRPHPHRLVRTIRSIRFPPEQKPRAAFIIVSALMAHSQKSGAHQQKQVRTASASTFWPFSWATPPLITTRPSI